jgi:two-component system nitrate/nitrite response regulator NarL
VSFVVAFAYWLEQNSCFCHQKGDAMGAVLARSGQLNPVPDVIRAYILSEVQFLYESLSQALASGPGFRVIGHCSTVAAILDATKSSRPDLILMDASFSGGVAAVRQILAATMQVRVVVLAVTETEETVLSWIRAGVSGYIPNTTRLVDLTRLLAGICRGEQPCSAKIAGSLLRQIGNDGPLGRAFPTPTLTERERQVLRLIGAGLGNKEIARELDISLATVKSHVHNVLGKLHVNHRGQASAWIHGAQ